MVILDGLDEVPATSNRDDLLQAVQGLLIDIAAVNGDVLVVATTRPQGYSQEFSPDIYQHIYLSPLSPTRAVHYGRRLSEARWGAEIDRADKVVKGLEAAVKEKTTARLMRSPLQVTIMATLIDQGGPPPQDRWPLFKQYYDVIYRRELAKPTPAAQLLRDFRPDIDDIHRTVGLLLQVNAEEAGGTESKLLPGHLESIIEDRLSAEGHEDDELTLLKGKFMDAAINRLVFLVGLEAESVGFEIRSLQEFMAAESLLSGSDVEVTHRLQSVGSISSWNNVWLFAAGHCFGRTAAPFAIRSIPYVTNSTMPKVHCHTTSCWVRGLPWIYLRTAPRADNRFFRRCSLVLP